MGDMIIALYVTGALINLLLMLIFREAFTDTPYRKRVFTWICVGATILSFVLWLVCIVIIVFDSIKHYNDEKKF